jgi:O-antigen/teichoic acid export membrane protein/glycosyltransferase involved in cell wall biosynthesis
MSDLRDRTLSGLKWSGAAQVARQALQFAVSVLLARMLSPEQFGLMGMIMVFTGLATIFSEMGLGAALVQKKDLEDRHLSSIFWVNAATGVVLTALFAACASGIAAFYGQPALRALTLAVSLNFFLGSLAIVQRGIIMRAMDFRKLFVIETAAILFSGAAALAAALGGLGVWSLVAQSLVYTATMTAVSWLLSPWRPAWKVDKGALRELFGYSANLLGFNVLNFSNRNLDNLLVGRFIGAYPLGVYTRAYTLMLLPISQVTSILTRVMFPAMSAIQGDAAQVKRVYLRATRAIALVTFPLMIGLLVTAGPLIPFVYGEKWRGVIPLVKIFCFIGMIDSITTTTGWIFNSQGRTDLQLRWGIADFVVTTASFFIGLPWGIEGIAAAYVVCGYVMLYPCWLIAGRLIGLRFGEMVRNLSRTFFCAAAMGLAVAALGRVLPPGWPGLPRLAALILGGAALYVSLIHFFEVEAYKEVRALLAEKSGSKRAVHFKLGAFLALTENWIHGQIRHLKRWEPIVYASSRENADLFPVGLVRTFAIGGRGPWSLFNRASSRIAGMTPAMAAAMILDRPRVIHAHFGPSGYAALGLSKRFAVPLVTTFYGYDLTQLPEREPMWRERYRRLFEAGDLFLVEGGHMRGRLVALGCPEAKAVVHHIGVDVAAIPYRTRELDAEGEIRILCAATFTEKKGLPYAVAAVGLLQRAHPDWKLRLTIIGDARATEADAEEKRKILRAVEEYDLRARVSMLGFRSQAELHEQFYKHHLFLSPSVTARDGNTEGGAPVSIIEASASGLPVVATTHCDIPEVVVDGVTGLLAPERDPKALAAKLELLCASPSKRAEFGLAGRRHIEREYDSAKLGPRLEEAYDEVC